MSALLRVAELAAALAERELSLRVWTPLTPAHLGTWVAWLFADDDPELGTFVGSGVTLAEALANAMARWDGAVPRTPRTAGLQLVPPPPPPPPGSKR